MKRLKILSFCLFLIFYTILLRKLFQSTWTDTDSAISIDSKSKSKETERVWNEIAEFFDSVTLYNAKAVIKTLRYQRDQVDEHDKELVAFVSSLIVAPSKKDLSLINKDKVYYSQIGQDQYIDGLLKQLEGGFFIEAGAFEGEALSNTLFFEKSRKWTGLLIEPLPDQFENVLSKNRNVFAINACISGGKPFVAKFKVCHVLSGIADKMSANHQQRVKNECKNAKNIFVPCFSLSTILAAINVTKVDYFSLDVEGAEWDIIKDLRFDKIPITALTVEYNGAEDVGTIITNHLLKNSYKLTKKDNQDLYFLKN
jgi:FkbM family methyltransferase